MSTTYRSLCLGAAFVVALSLVLSVVAAWPGCGETAESGCGIARQVAAAFIAAFLMQIDLMWPLLKIETLISLALGFGFLTALFLQEVDGRFGEKLTCLVVVLYTPWLVTLNVKMVPWALDCVFRPAGQDAPHQCDLMASALASFYAITGVMWLVNVVVPLLAAVGAGYLVLRSWVFVVHKVIH